MMFKNKKKEKTEVNPNEPLFMKTLEEIVAVIDHNEITVLEAEEIIFPEALKIVKGIAIVPYKKRMSRAQRLDRINKIN